MDLFKKILKHIFPPVAIGLGALSVYITSIWTGSSSIGFVNTWQAMGITGLIPSAAIIFAATMLMINNYSNFFKKTLFLPGVSFQPWKFKFPKVGNNTLKLPTVLGFQAPDIKVGLPAFAGLHVTGGFRKVGVMAVALGLIATLGIFFATTAKLDQAPTWPSAAIYDAEVAYNLNEKKLNVGEKNSFPADTPEVKRHTQTLKILVGGARVSTLNFEDISLGKPSGLAVGLQIVGTTANTLQCDEIILDGVEAPTFSLSNSRIYELVIKDNAADGLSISPALSSTASDIEVGSSRGALSIPAATNSTYDRIIIDTSAADSVCEKLTLKNIKLYGTYSGKAVDLQNIDAGKLTIQNSVIGDGTGIDSASFFVLTSTAVSTASLTNNGERPITIK